jgi:energy-coupling factor transport system permease protein
MPVGYSIYVDTPSAIHQKIDPRTKLVAMIAIFALAMEFQHPLILGTLIVFVILVGISAHLSFMRFLPILVGAMWFLILGVVIWPAYIHQGRVVGKLFGHSITADGLLFGVAMGLRVGLLLMAAGVWMMVTSPQKMTLGLLRMGLPYKAGLTMSTAIRFVPLINAERSKIMEAQRARGLNAGRGGPLSRLRKYVSIIGPMVLRSVDLAEMLATAMDARGFGAREGITSMTVIQMTAWDWLVIVLCVIAVLAGLVLRILGIGVIVKGFV